MNKLKNKFLVIIFFIYAIFCATQAWCAPEPLSVAAQMQVLPSTTVPIAETAQIQIRLISNQKIFLSSAALPDQPDLHFLKSTIAPSEEKPDHSFETRLTIDFMPLNIGTMTIPSLTLSYTVEQQQNFAVTPPAHINVTGTLDQNVSPDMLKDIKKPIPAGVLLWPWLLTVGVLLAAGASWWWFKSRKQASEPAAPPEPPRPAHIVALEKLNAILAEYRKNNDAKIFYVELSNIFREYISRALGMDALEKTTQEIFSGMRKKQIDRKLCLQVKEILADSDLVKFAKFIPEEKQIMDDFERVKNWIEQQHSSIPTEEKPA